MNRQVPKHFIIKDIAKPVSVREGAKHNEELVKLTQELKPYLQEAAADLLQPRPEAVAQLLKKSLVNKSS